MSTVEIEVPASSEPDDKLVVAGAVGRTNVLEDKPVEKPAVEVEVVDDTPPADRGRKPAPPPDEVTDEELGQYSEKVQKRLKHLSRGYHDERRAKEQAAREKEELERFAKTLLAENNQLKGTVNRSQTTLLDQAKKAVTAEVELAKKRYREAYEAGNADELLAAQEALTTAQIKSERVASFKPTPLQQQEVPVKQPQPAPVTRDERAEDWTSQNPWFGSDEEMTAYALGLHNKLVKEGVDPRGDAYYETLNTRMRQLFPERFDEPARKPKETATPAPRTTSSTVVAPVSRSNAPIKVTLTQTQVQLAKKLGVPLDVYAQNVADLMRKEAHG